MYLMALGMVLVAQRGLDGARPCLGIWCLLQTVQLIFHKELEAVNFRDLRGPIFTPTIRSTSSNSFGARRYHNFTKTSILGI